MSGIMGMLHKASPVDACSPLVPSLHPARGSLPLFVLIERGVCNFDVKMRNAQEAGFEAAIVYNNQDDHELVTSMPSFPIPLNVIALLNLTWSPDSRKHCEWILIQLHLLLLECPDKVNKLMKTKLLRS